MLLLVGLSLLLYPSVSDYWNSFHQSRAIASYAEQVANIDNDIYAQLWEDARAYNQTLVGKENRFQITDEERETYESLLNVGGNGIIGYIEIAKIGCSLPTGGESTHCVVSGHRGLPSAKLFTDLDRLIPGDTFVLRVQDETLTYEVDQILIVEPQELAALEIEEGRDYCTLVTCTPYGINTHRLLVRGHRVANAEEAVQIRVTADAIQIEPVLVAPLVAVPMLLILLAALLVSTRKKRR